VRHSPFALALISWILLTAGATPLLAAETRDVSMDYRSALQASGQNPQIPFRFQRQENGNAVFIRVFYEPQGFPMSGRSSPVALLVDDDKDGVIDRFRDHEGHWHWAAARRDWITSDNQLTPLAFEVLEAAGKNDLSYGFCGTAKDFSHSVADYLTFTTRQMRVADIEINAHLDLIEALRTEMETVERGSDLWEYGQAVIAQHEDLLTDYIQTTRIYCLGRSVTLDYLLLVPGALEKVTVPLSRGLNRASIWLMDRVGAKRLATSAVERLALLKGKVPEPILRAAAVTAGSVSEALTKSASLVSGLFARLKLGRIIAKNPKLDEVLTKYIPIHKVFASKYRSYLRKNVAWSFSTTLIGEKMARGDQFAKEWDEVLQHLIVAVAFSAIATPMTELPTGWKKTFVKAPISFLYAATDATLAHGRINGFRHFLTLPDGAEFEYLMKKESMSIVWGVTAANNNSMATDEAAVYFKQFRGRYPGDKFATDIAESLFRMTSRIFSQYSMRAANREMVGYKAPKPKSSRPHRH